MRIFTSVLLPAPLAPISAWTSPGAHFQRRGLERDDRAESLGDIRAASRISVEVMQQSTAQWHSAPRRIAEPFVHLTCRRRVAEAMRTKHAQCWLPRRRLPAAGQRQLSPGPLQAFSWSGGVVV